jgi:hypothetical protein
MRIQKIFFFSILASLLSSLKLFFLPELELVILFIIMFYRDKMLFAVALVIILCSHHYVIPDEVYRFDSTSYPSIYTKKIGPTKILDIVTIIFFLFSITFFNFKLNSFSKINLNYPFILLLFCFAGIITTPILNQNFDLLFFNIRNLLLLISTYLLLKNLDLIQIKTISFVAISCWLSKMIFSIIFPASNPLYREIFGITWNIYFAGDEYLTLGVYFISILLLNKISNVNNFGKEINVLKLLIIVSLITALISQRKGALIYFFTIYILVNYNKKSKFSILQNIFILFLPFSTFLFLIFILPLFSDLINLVFFDQSGLLDSSIESINYIFNFDFFHFIFGIGPYSLYEIKGLNDILDNEMAFGAEVGNKFRYMIWSLPFGRLFLNVGLFGSFIYLFYLFKNLQKPPSYFYLYSISLPVFFLENISPVTALSIGFAFVVMSKYNKLIKSENNGL